MYLFSTKQNPWYAEDREISVPWYASVLIFSFLIFLYYIIRSTWFNFYEGRRKVHFWVLHFGDSRVPDSALNAKKTITRSVIIQIVAVELWYLPNLSCREERMPKSTKTMSKNWKKRKKCQGAPKGYSATQLNCGKSSFLLLIAYCCLLLKHSLHNYFMAPGCTF